MHTAICAFDDRATADHAVNALVRSGFARADVHIEHIDLYPHLQAWSAESEHRPVMEPDRGLLSSFGHFFASLLGLDHHSGHVEKYAQHVESGSYVLVVDAHEETDAQRADAIMRELEARDPTTVHRPVQRPLRDIVGMRQDGIQQGQTAGMVERSREPYEGWTPSSSAMQGAGERAMASHTLAPMTGPDLREPEVGRAPGLRYADKDKPNG